MGFRKNKKAEYFPFRFLVLPHRKIIYKVKRGIMLTLPRVGEFVVIEQTTYAVDGIRHFVGPTEETNSIDIFIRIADFK